MTTDELRIAVAESLGWHSIHHGGISPLGNTPDMVRTVEAYQKIIPNYPTSLDACREFEKTIPCSGPEPTICAYVKYLEEEQPHPQGTWATCLFATAEQRCRAWLKYCETRKV